MRFIIRGVHPIEAAEPCHLIEVEVPDGDNFDWGEVTQEDSTQPQSDWQVAYDEQPVDKADGPWAFYFHHLDLNKPLMTPAGPIQLPAPTPLPANLMHLQYFEP